MRHNRVLLLRPHLRLHQFKKRVILIRTTNRSLTHLMAERKGRVERKEQAQRAERKGKVRQEQVQLGREHKLLNRHHRRKHPLNHTCNHNLRNTNNHNKQNITRINLRNLPQPRTAWVLSQSPNLICWSILELASLTSFYHRGKSKKKGYMGIYAFCDTHLL